MTRKRMRTEQARRIVFVGCQFCGATDKPLRNYGSSKICSACLKRKGVSKLDTRKEKHD